MGSYRVAVCVALVGLVGACTPVPELGLRVADEADYDLEEGACVLDGALASVSGALRNRTDAARPWAVSAAFRDGERGLSSATDVSEGAVPAGAEWRWRVEVTVDPQRVRPEALRCDVVRVDLGDPVED